MMRYWRRTALSVLAVALIAAPCAVRAQSENQSVNYYGVEFPPAFAEGQRISTRDFEPTSPGLGFSAGYRHRGAVSTLYIYDARTSAIPDDLNAGVVTAQFEQAKNDIRRAQSDSATITSKGKFTIADANGRPRLNCEGFDLKRGSTEARLDTFLCVGVANGKFFKVRTTMPQSAQSQSEVERFVGAWAAKIWKS
jgi:hypothetical protein